MADVLQEIATNLYAGKADAVAQCVQRALNDGQSATDVLSGGMMAGMDAVGRDFKNGDIYVPDVLMAARAMNAGMAILRPLLIESGAPTAGKCVLATVRGDIHDIGKNLVRMMLQGGGFEVIDLGSDVGGEGFVAAVREHRPALVGMSALLTTTMFEMKSIIDALKEAGLRDSVKIMVGGAPLGSDFAAEIGADGYAPDAASAVDLARQLLA